MRFIPGTGKRPQEAPDATAKADERIGRGVETLLAAIEPPADMPERFAALLAEVPLPDGASQGGETTGRVPFPRRLLRSGRDLAAPTKGKDAMRAPNYFLRAGLVAGFAGVLAVAAVLVPSNRSGGDGGIAEARAFLEALPERLDVEPGQVIYIRTERYLRFGSRAGQIRAVADITTEERLHEAWMEVGADGVSSRAFTRTFDGNGVLVQQTARDGTHVRTINPADGELLGETTLPEVSDIRTLHDAVRIDSYLEAGDARVIRQTDTALTVEAVGDFPDSVRERELRDNQFTLPFYNDLELERAIFVWTIDERGVLVGTEFYAETAGGERVLIESQRVTEFKILDTMPAAVEDGF